MMESLLMRYYVNYNICRPVTIAMDVLKTLCHNVKLLIASQNFYYSEYRKYGHAH
jgi:hypothetical protein